MLVLGLVYAYQPIELEFLPKEAPSYAKKDPESDLLFAKGTRVLVVTAHPDDSEFYIGGTLSILTKTAEIHQVICTDGDKAYYPFEDHERNRRVRREEARRAADAWKGRSVEFLAYPDGRLAVTQEAVQRVQAVIERLRPQYILTFDPEYPPRARHRDHRLTGEIAWAAAQGSGVPTWVLQFATRAPNFVVDVSDVWDRKEALLAIHSSQFSGPKLEGVKNMVANTAETEGSLIDTSLGEGFRVVKLPGANP